MIANLVAALAALLLLLSCSKEGNPVPLPTSPGSGAAIALTLKADAGQLVAGTAAPATLTVSAVHADGSAVADGTPVNLNTNLGAFGYEAAGKPVQSAALSLAAGRATAQFFAGPTAGTANIMAAAGTSLAALNLPIVAAPAPPVANFTFSANGRTVSFIDASTGSPNAWLWDFGDGSAKVTDRNPTHVYTAAATYTVTLVASNAGGQSNKSQFVPVSLGLPPKAAFDFTVTGRQVNFVDLSTDATARQWSFGDGTGSDLPNPAHTYFLAGPYTVTLTASNAAGSTSASKVVTIASAAPPKAAFTFAVTGSQANFVDASTDALTWQWNFGDHSPADSSRNPIHIYAAPGAYTVTLSVTNDAGSDSAAKVVTIAAGQPPKSAFTFKANGLLVTFADASTGNPATWLWSFGDGATSTLPNPVHNYGAYGNYTVSLQVANANGSNSSSQIVSLVATPPVASFIASPSHDVGNFQCNFVDTSTGNPTSWTWDFGDGSPFRFDQNPVHVYAQAGMYTVTLTVANSSGTSKATQVVATAPASSQ